MNVQLLNYCDIYDLMFYLKCQTTVSDDFLFCFDKIIVLKHCAKCNYYSQNGLIMNVDTLTNWYLRGLASRGSAHIYCATKNLVQWFWTKLSGNRARRWQRPELVKYTIWNMCFWQNNPLELMWNMFFFLPRIIWEKGIS